LDEALQRLGTTDRAAVIAFYLDGVPQRTIAEQLGMTEEAAKKRIHRALGKLRTVLQRRGVAISATTLLAGMASEAPLTATEAVAACIHAAANPTVAPHAAAIAKALALWAAAKKAAIAAGLMAAIGVTSAVIAVD